jgi:hypothetical protein
MKKKIFAICGLSNSGKSTTIRLVYDSLLSTYKIPEQKNTILRKDVYIILSINGVKIGIASKGDPSTELAKRLSALKNAGCQLIICATRTRGETVDAVGNLKPYEVHWFEKVRVSDVSERNESNMTLARRIVMEVKGHLKGK